MIKIFIPGIFDFAFNFLVPFFLLLLVNVPYKDALIFSAVLYPSSTAITTKLLMDYKRLANPESDFLIGLLVFEDLICVLILSLYTPIFSQVSKIPLVLQLIIVTSAFAVFYILSKLLFLLIQKTTFIFEEPVLLFFIVGVITIIFFGMEHVGVSGALGSFLLGVSIPEGEPIKRIEKGLSGLKELSIGVFFFAFAFKSQMSLPGDYKIIILILAMAFILKPVSTYLGARIYGLKKKVSLRASLSFVQRGEFSLIFSIFSPALSNYVVTSVFITAFLGSFAFAFANEINEITKLTGRITSLPSAKSSS